MRRFAFLAAVLLVASPVFAAGNSNSAPSFGSATCSYPESCSAYSGIMASDPRLSQLIARANSCVGANFDLRDGEGYFKEERGLDSSLCLTTKQITKNTVGATPTPRCCLVALGNDSCQLRCELQAIR